MYILLCYILQNTCQPRQNRRPNEWYIVAAATNKYLPHLHCLIALDGFLMGCFAYGGTMPKKKQMKSTFSTRIMMFEWNSCGARKQLEKFFFRRSLLVSYFFPERRWGRRGGLNLDDDFWWCREFLWHFYSSEHNFKRFIRNEARAHCSQWTCSTACVLSGCRVLRPIFTRISYDSSSDSNCHSNDLNSISIRWYAPIANFFVIIW